MVENVQLLQVRVPLRGIVRAGYIYIYAYIQFMLDRVLVCKVNWRYDGYPELNCPEVIYPGSLVTCGGLLALAPCTSHVLPTNWGP